MGASLELKIWAVFYQDMMLLCVMYNVKIMSKRLFEHDDYIAEIILYIGVKKV